MSGTGGSRVRQHDISCLPDGISPDAATQYLEKILSSRHFVRSERLRRFLRFAVESVLEGEPDRLKEYIIGVQIFDRGDGFDPRADAIVRTEATRLRRKLGEYYQTIGQDDPVIITIPRGGYVPLFQKRKDWNGTSAVQSLPQRERPERQTVDRSYLVVVLGVAIVAAAVSGWYLSRVNSSPEPTLHSVPLTSLPGWERGPALSPKGDQVAFTWNGGQPGNHDVYLKLIDGGPPLQLTTDSAPESYPAWSPDGSRLAFLRETETGADLYEVSAFGGPERILAKLSMPSHDISWSPNGLFLAVEDQPPGETKGIFLVSALTGEKRRLTSPPEASVSDRWPAFSPDGGALAFARGKTNFNLYVLPLDQDGTRAGEPRRLTQKSLHVEGLDWTPDGRAVVVAALIDDLWWRLWTVAAEGGEPVPVQIEGGSAKQPSVARLQSGSKGRLAYVSYSSDSNIYGVPGPGAQDAEPSAQEIVPKLIVGSSRYDTAPRFSPSGERIAFVSDRSGHSELWVANCDGSNPMQITSLSGPSVGGPRWSPDGERIVFDASEEHRDVFVVGAGGGPVRRLTTEASNEGGASWSRDGRWIYFVSDASGRSEIRRMPAEGGQSVRVVERGLPAFESPDGEWLYYPKSYPSQGDPGIWRIPVAGGEEEQVLEEGVSGAWGLSQSGIYLLKPGGPDQLPTIELFRYDTWEREVVFEFPNVERFGMYNAFAVSEDDRSILYVQYSQTEADLMLVENFQ